MLPLSANNKLKATFLLLWFVCHSSVLSFNVIEKCEEGCRNQESLDENAFDIACNNTCKLFHCQIGCQRWTYSTNSCQQACNDSSNVNSWVLYCVLGCNHALSVYTEQINAEVGIPSAPFLVADSLTNESLVIEWSAAPYANITYLVQWKYESLESDWNYYNPDLPLATSRMQIKGLNAYTQYRFRVAWILLPQTPPLLSKQSVIISTLPYGVPSSSPTITAMIAVSSTQISVSWEPPRFPNGPILSYALYLNEFANNQIIVKDVPNFYASDSDNKSLNALHHYMFNGLKANTAYKVTVLTRNNFGEGPSDEKSVTTLESEVNKESQMTATIPDLILATDKEVIRRDPQFPIDSEVLFRLNDFTASAKISGLAVHVELKYIFVSDTSGTVRRISLNDENKQIITLLKDRSREPSHLSVDWLYDKLYLIEENKISRCNLEGENMESVITGFKTRPKDIKVDPYNGYLYWLMGVESTNAGLYRVDLANIDHNFMAYNYAEHIYSEPSLTTFSVDYANYLIYFPLKREASIFSITIDGKDATNIRHNSQRNDQFKDINNLVVHDRLFYFTSGTEFYSEEYERGIGKYHHNSIQIDANSLVALCVMDPKSQPSPIPLNPVSNVEAVFLDRSAKIVWQKPELLGGSGLGAWQRWSYEVSIEETSSRITFLDRGLPYTHCEADELSPDTEYSIKVRGYSAAGNGSWSANFHGKTLQKKDPNSRFPFALWSTQDGVLKSNIVGDRVEHLVHRMNMNDSTVNDITWYRDAIFINANSNVYVYNITSHSNLIKLKNITSVSSIAIDWIAPKLYWSSAAKHMIGRSNLDGGQSEPLIETVANEIAVDSVKGYLYWSTGYEIGFSRLNGMDKTNYFELELFSGKHLMGLSLNFDDNLIYWLVRSDGKALLYSAELAKRENLHKIAQTITIIGQLKETQLIGPLVYYSDRIFWLQHQRNETLISDKKGQHLASLRGSELLQVNAISIVDPTLQPLPDGFHTFNDLSVIPHHVNELDIKVVGTWDNYSIIWETVDNVNYGVVFYDLMLEDRHERHTIITKETKYLYASSIQLPPYSKIKLAIRAFTYWASSKQTVAEIYTPMSIPTKPTMPRVFIFYERSIYDNTIEKINAEFRWSSPELTNGDISGYIVNVWTFQSDQKIIEVDNERVAGSSNKIILSELKVNTTYYFQVQASTEAGDGPASDIVEAVSSDEHPVPHLMVTKSDSISLVDVDSHENKIIHLKTSFPVSAAYVSKENKIFWIEEDGVLKWSHRDGTNLTIVGHLEFPVSDLTVDWVGRRLYWTENDPNSYKSTIWSYDYNNRHSKPFQITTENNVVFGSLEFDPFMSILIWTEIRNNGEATIKMLNTNDFRSNVKLFFKSNKIPNKHSSNDDCNCHTNAKVGKALAIDRSDESNTELLWFDAKHGRIMASDLTGCRCRILINHTYSFPPTSMAADSDFIYWLTSTLGNVYKVRKRHLNEENESHTQTLDRLYSSLNSPHFVLSERAHSINSIQAFGNQFQPYPNFDCLIPMDYNETVQLIDNTANSLLISIPEVKRPLSCSHITLSSVLYTIYYGKVFSNGSFECGVSLSGCKTYDTYNSTVSVNGLEPFTNYSVSVAVKNYYSPKNKVNLPGPAVILETAEARPSPPRNVIARVDTPRRMSVIWEPPEKPNGEFISYEMRWFTSSNNDWHRATYAKKPNTTQFGDKFIMYMNDIQPSLTYFISIRAYSSDSVYHSDSNTISAIAYPLPNDIILENRSSRTLTVSWMSPITHSNISDIAQHTMQFCMNDDNRWFGQESTLTVSSTRYVFTFSDLVPNSEYSFRLLLTYRSTTSLFEWPETGRYTYKTSGDTPNTPQPPTVEEMGNQMYRVSWNAVDTNGAQNVFYNLMLKEFSKSDENKNSDTWMTVYNDTLNYWLIEDIAMDRNYVFKVEALSEFGASDCSNESIPFYYPNREVLISTETNIITIIFIILGLFLCLIVILIISITVYKRQDQDSKKCLEQNGIHRIGTDVELVPWPELPRHPHHTNALYTNSLDLDEDLTRVTKITHEQIKKNHLLGRGAFGEVYEGIWYRSDLIESKMIKVAIKTLLEGASEEQRYDFIKEAKLMANFNHPNILHLLGISLDTNINFLILELMEGGDLIKYLRSHRPCSAIPSQLTMDDLISICVDVAKGCKYLEEIHFVHRDLAARNCLVSSYDRSLRVVKIGDFGLARDIYKNDYYRKEGEGLLPVRWMAPESLVDGVFTSQSDVWSFGVLLYEVMSLGEQPYQARSNAQVLNYVRVGGTLDRPINCPDDMYCLMKCCWTYQREDRPSFSECLETLENIRKNMLNSPSTIISVHNQNYFSRRGVDNPGYEDEKQAGSSHKLKRLSSGNNSAQSCLTSITSDTSPYQNGHMKYLELVGNHEEMTDADGYQIPISKSPLQSSNEKNTLLNTMNRIVLNSSDVQRVAPIASARNKLTNSMRSCSPPPTYFQVFKPDITLDSDSNYKNSSNEHKMDEISSHNGLSLSHETKNNCILVSDDHKRESNLNCLSQASPLSLSPSSSSPTLSTCPSGVSASSPTISPTVAAALLKAQSPLNITAPSRTMTAIKYCFGEDGLPKKTCNSLQSDEHRSSNTCSTEDEEDYDDFDTETIAANELFSLPSTGVEACSAVTNNGYANSCFGQINNQSKYAAITQLNKSASFNFDTNSSWC